MKKVTDWSMGKIARDMSGKVVGAARDAPGKAVATVRTKSAETYQQFTDNQKPLSAENWFERTAEASEALSDAVMGSPGWTNRLVTVASSKLGAVAVPASLLSVAALVGTASTGTAIGALNGAAYTSAALAWIGGSVAMGTVIVATAGVAGMVAAPFLVRPLSKKYLTGRARDPSELSEAETDLVNACCALSLGLRQAAKSGASLDSRKAHALHDDALRPLLDKAADVLPTSQRLPMIQRRSFNNAFWSLGLSKGFAKEMVSNREPIAIGLGTALVLNLLSEGEHTFSEAELDVLEAIRRSSGEMSGATNEEIAAHVQSMTPEQLIGFKNNIKGIAHELQYARLENNDGDLFQVELFDATNHAGADVKLINIETGEVQELQLKATSYAAYVEDHFAKYPDIDVLATSEVSATLGVETTGVSDEQLSSDVHATLNAIEPGQGFEIPESMAIAGLVTLARNVNIILTSDAAQQDKRRFLVQKGIKAGLVAGIAELLI
ncbi:MAG: hypothetical protein ACSHXW_14770 [Yoonia sp.]